MSGRRCNDNILTLYGWGLATLPEATLNVMLH